jgi:hypothetical protein
MARQIFGIAASSLSGYYLMKSFRDAGRETSAMPDRIGVSEGGGGGG